MSEEKAKTKWCPQTLGRTPPNPECCAGSSCMAWRWSNEAPAEQMVPTDDRARWERVGWSVKIAGSDQSLMVMAPSGFCGLAGRPA